MLSWAIGSLSSKIYGGQQGQEQVRGGMRPSCLVQVINDTTQAALHVEPQKQTTDTSVPTYNERHEERRDEQGASAAGDWKDMDDGHEQGGWDDWEDDEETFQEPVRSKGKPVGADAPRPRHEERMPGIIANKRADSDAWDRDGGGEDGGGGGRLADVGDDTGDGWGGEDAWGGGGDGNDGWGAGGDDWGSPPSAVTADAPSLAVEAGWRR